MSFRDEIKNRLLVFDGSMGRMLHENGLGVGTCPEEWNLTHPEILKRIYKSYKDSGSDVVQTNTFQSNRIKLEEYGLNDKHFEINYQAVKLAKEAADGKCYVAASIGPLGKLLEPFGELTFEKAYDTFKDQIMAVAEGGADIISLETFTDISELRIALLAAKENCELPVICSVSYEQNGRTLMGTEPDICAVILHSMGADLIGTNCSFGPEYMLEIAEKYRNTGLPFSVKPNAGLPEIIDGKQVFKETPVGFARLVPEFIKNGARLLGGCCGTTPQYIAEVAKLVKETGSEISTDTKNLDVDYITSTSHKLAFESIKSAKLGRIDAGKDKFLRDSLNGGDLASVTDSAMELLDEKYDIVLIDMDRVNSMDTLLLAKVVKEAQTYLKQPFVLKSDSIDALEAALRIYKGRAGYIMPVGTAMPAGTGNSTPVIEAAKLLAKYGAVDCGGLINNEE